MREQRVGPGPELGGEPGNGAGLEVERDGGLDFEYRTQRQRVLFGTGRAAELLATVLGELGAQGEQRALGAQGELGAQGALGALGALGAQALSTQANTPGAPRVMVVATRRELERSAAVLAGIRAVLVFDEVVQHVPAESAGRAHRAAQAAGIDVVVALGGGSAIGLAKILALQSERPGGLSIVAVPTTYSGSEATAVWGLVENGVKTTGFDPRVLPGTVIYDAALTLSLPRELSVSSALNALAHGVDALWAPGANPVSALIAVEGIRMLARALPHIAAESGAGEHRDAPAALGSAASPEAVAAEDALDSPTGMAAGAATGSDPALVGGGIRGSLAGREDALYGAYLAASAFSSAGSGLHHKICHVLGGAFGLPHAQTHAIVLPHVVALNAPAAPEAEARIASALGSRSAVEGLLALRERAHAPTALRDVGFRESDIARAVALILPVVPASNPRAVTSDDLTLLLRNAWGGGTPGGM